VFGVWGLGPKPKSPIPNPQSPYYHNTLNNYSYYYEIILDFK
jgi:hypothetical protein